MRGRPHGLDHGSGGAGGRRRLMGVAHVSASFSAILRVRLADEAGAFGRVATAIGEEGALLGAIDLVRVEPAHKVRDVTILAEDETHIERVAAAVNAIAGVE